MTVKATGTDIKKISALNELVRADWKYSPGGGNEVRCLCPCHDDHDPSVSLNIEENIWQCKAASCGAKGDIVTLLCHIYKCDRNTMLAELSKRYDLKVIRTINPEVVEKFHEQIWNAGFLLKELYKRGLIDEDIREARLGFDGKRITIPVYDKSHRIINVRKYLPGAPGPEKMRNVAGYTALALYQREQVALYPVVWICGGEMKALVAKRFLNTQNVGATSVTGGEGSWDVSFNDDFKGKHVFVCMDIDTGGKVAAKRVAAQLAFIAASIRIIYLPLDKTKYPKGDINDWVGGEKAGESEFKAVMDTAERFVLEDISDADRFDSEIKPVTLAGSTAAENVGRRISCEAIVSAIDTTPYIIPSKINVICTKDQPNCHYCPIRAKDPDEESGQIEMIVAKTSVGILEMVHAPKKMQKQAIKTALRVPDCKIVEFNVKEFYNVIDARLIPQLTISGDNSDYVILPAYIVANEVELNCAYVFTGRMFPHPRNQQAVLIFGEVEELADSLSMFQPKDEELESLKIFRPVEWSKTGIEQKLNEIYNDFETNVTRIFRRRELHFALDLAFCSALYFRFDNKVENGWMNCLIVGDSSQGKSDASLRIMEHYGLGIRHDCKNASIAGLLGGCEQLGTRWFISWGVIPQQDKRLVIMEEVKGIPLETISRLTDMRSSGVAEISKIEKRRAHARTRLVMVSNPRSNRPVAAYNFGIEVIKELIGNPEDIRRFDFAVILAVSQVNADEINKLSSSRKAVEHKFTNDICRKRVLWTWTRDVNQIRIDDDAIDLCLKSATQLCNTYTEIMPLCDRGTMRLKLLRLAISLAGITFSTLNDNLKILQVKKCHVEYIVDWLNQQYSSNIFGYSDFTKAQMFANNISDSPMVVKWIKQTKHPKDLIEQLLHNDEITPNDLQDWCELDRDNTQQLISLFVRKHCVYRQGRGYVKTIEFITLLKKMKMEIPPEVSVPFAGQEF